MRAGLTKLRKLGKDFAAMDPSRHPKMLEVCQDTTVSPLVAKFLRDQEGLQEDKVMTIDSGKKSRTGLGSTHQPADARATPKPALALRAVG